MIKIKKQSWLTPWLPVLLWMALIFALSSVSGLRSGLVEGLDLVLRKIAHAAEFGILGALVLRALRPHDTRRRDYVFAFLIAGLYAVSDEIHQGFVVDRVGAVRDVAIDCLGVVVGIDLRRRWLKRSNLA